MSVSEKVVVLEALQAAKDGSMQARAKMLKKRRVVGVILIVTLT